jgi:hypothetical protein
MAKFKDPIDEEADIAEGTKRSVAEFEKLAQENPEGTVEVPVGEEDDDPDDALDKEERPTRKERRAARGADYKTVREQRAAAEARAQALEEQLQFERSRVPTQQQGPQGGPDVVKQLQAEVGKVYEEQSALMRDYEARVAAYRQAERVMPKEEWKRFDDKARELDEKRTELLLDVREARRAPMRAQEEQHRALVARAPDVFANQRAATWAGAEYSRRIAENPQIDRDQLIDECVEGARRVILGKRPPPDQAQRQRATGMSRGAGVTSSAAPSALPMSKDQRTIARAAHPKLSPAQAYQKWANENAKELQEMERESGRRA